jgi:hypothetical protein
MASLGRQSLAFFNEIGPLVTGLLVAGRWAPASEHSHSLDGGCEISQSQNNKRRLHEIFDTTRKLAWKRRLWFGKP